MQEHRPWGEERWWGPVKGRWRRSRRGGASVHLAAAVAHRLTRPSSVTTVEVLPWKKGWLPLQMSTAWQA
jgi:hypothetical protein